MSEYWVSQAKKHCDFCKCWIADNKPSKDFHERGKRHLENVKKKIEEVRKKSILKAQQDEEMSDSLRQMEENALRALKRDLIKNPSMASQYGVKLKPKAPPNVFGPEVRPQTTDGADEQEPAADSDGAKKEKEVEKGEVAAVTSEGTWHMAASEQGYPYYWNDITSAKGSYGPLITKPEYDRPKIPEVSWVPPPAYLAQQEETIASTSTVEDIEEEDGERSDKSSSTSPPPSDKDQVDEEVHDDEAATCKPEQPARKRPVYTDPVKRAKQPQPDIYKLRQPVHKKPRVEAPVVLADIPLPGDMPLPSSSSPSGGACAEEAGKPQTESLQDNLPTERSKPTGSTHRPKSHTAYGTWAQVEQEQDVSEIDLGLPEVRDKIVPAVSVPVGAPRFKVREKTVSSLGSGPVFFRKPKKKITAAQFLKKREET